MQDVANQKIILENNSVQLVPLNLEHTTECIHYALTEPTIWQYSMVNPGGSASAMENTLLLQ